MVQKGFKKNGDALPSLAHLLFCLSYVGCNKVWVVCQRDSATSDWPIHLFFLHIKHDTRHDKFAFTQMYETCAMRHVSQQSEWIVSCRLLTKFRSLQTSQAQAKLRKPRHVEQSLCANSHRGLGRRSNGRFQTDP